MNAKLSLLLIAVSLATQATAESKIYQITCKNYHCIKGIQQCVDHKCYGPQCPACMQINFPVCSECTDSLESDENYLDIAGQKYLICDPQFENQRIACNFTCRTRFKPGGECSTVLGKPLCICGSHNSTQITTPPTVSPVTTTPTTTTTDAETSTSTTSTTTPAPQPVNPDYGKLERQLNGHSGTIWTLASLPNGRLASGSSDKSVKIWDPNTGKVVKDLVKHTSSVYALAVLLDGRFASGSADHTIIVWNADTYAQIATLKGHTGSVKALAVMPNGDLASASEDLTIRIWNPEDFLTEKILRGHQMAITTLAVLSNGLLASGSEDGTIMIWNSDVETPLRTLKSDFSGSVYSLEVLKDGRLAAGYSRFGDVRLWNTDTFELETTLVGHEFPVLSFAVLPNGDFASGSSDKLIHIRDRNTYGLKRIFSGSSDSVEALALLTNGFLASAAEKVINIWNTI